MEGVQLLLQLLSTLDARNNIYPALPTIFKRNSDILLKFATLERFDSIRFFGRCSSNRKNIKKNDLELTSL